MTESGWAMGITGTIIGFLGNLVLMRNFFCSTKECETTREGCEKERQARLDAAEQRWEGFDDRLTRMELCMTELKLGWKENYKATCEIKALLHAQKSNSGA